LRDKTVIKEAVEGSMVNRPPRQTSKAINRWIFAGAVSDVRY
jgi:hypothetical protein